MNFNEIPKYDGCNTGMLGLKDPTAVHMKFKDKRFKMSLVRRRSSGKCISKCSNIKGTLNLNYVFFPCRLWLSPFLSVVASRVGVWLVCMGRGGGGCARNRPEDELLYGSVSAIGLRDGGGHSGFVCGRCCVTEMVI